MSNNLLTSWTLMQVLEAVNKKSVSEAEVARVYIERIGSLNPRLNAFLLVNEKCRGVPVGVKDVISTKGIRTSAASKILEDYIPPYDATVVARLKGEGVDIVGKTNMDEFAMGSSGENSAFGEVKNPWDLSRVAGGSSSGSAAAVAADLCVFALGSDTGGSIRQPASLCGVVGFKPSYGQVSRYGLIAMASSLDQIGPITKSVADARIVFDWIRGFDGFDANVSKKEATGKKKFERLKGLRVGVPKEYFGEGLDSEVRSVIEKALSKLESRGASIVEVSLPHSKYAVAVYYIIMPSEVSSNLARFDGIRFGGGREKFGPEVKRRIMLGTFALSSGYFEDYFIKAAKLRTLIKRDFEQVFEKCDVLVSPISPTVAWKIGEKTKDPLKMYLSDVYTIPASLAGVPAISLPCGGVGNLPVGLQVIAPFREDDYLLDVAGSFEEVVKDGWKGEITWM